MNLQQGLGLQNTVNLLWDNYEGSDYYTYIIYRQSRANGNERIDSIPASINRYTDLKPPTDVISYYVAIELPNVIDPMGKLKSDSGPFSQSISNMAESSLTKTEIESDKKLVVYPNPSKGTFILSLQGDKLQSYSIAIFNMLGQVVYEKNHCKDGNNTIDASSLSNGLYLLKVNDRRSIITKTMVISK